MPASPYAEWLQAPERVVVTEDAALSARWGLAAREAKVSTPLAAEADAVVEAARRFGFRSGPLVEERIQLDRLAPVSALRGRVVTITVAGDPAYAAGVDVFVLGGEADHSTGMTALDVIRRL